MFAFRWARLNLASGNILLSEMRNAFNIITISVSNARWSQRACACDRSFRARSVDSPIARAFIDDRQTHGQNLAAWHIIPSSKCLTDSDVFIDSLGGNCVMEFATSVSRWYFHVSWAQRRQHPIKGKEGDNTSNEQWSKLRGHEALNR